MQTQPFVIERLNIDRRDDLYAASLKTRLSTSAGRTILKRGVVWAMTEMRGLRPEAQVPSGSSNTHPVASR